MVLANPVLVASSIDTTAVVPARRRSQLWRPCAKFLKSESRTLDSPDSEHFDSRSIAAGHPQPLDVGPGVSRGRRRIQQRKKRQPKASPSRGCSKRLGGAFRRTACKVEWTARATTVAVALAVPVDAELEATERGGDGRHRALTCTKQGQLAFEGDSCRRLSICEVFFCCPSEYMVGRKGSVQSESEAWERAETRST